MNEIEIGDLFCYNYFNSGDYNDYITEEIEIADEDNRYFWEAFNNNKMIGHKLKWIIKKESFDKVVEKVSDGNE